SATNNTMPSATSKESVEKIKLYLTMINPIVNSIRQQISDLVKSINEVDDHIIEDVQAAEEETDQESSDEDDNGDDMEENSQDSNSSTEVVDEQQSGGGASTETTKAIANFILEMKIFNNTVNMMTQHTEKINY